MACSLPSVVRRVFSRARSIGVIQHSTAASIPAAISEATASMKSLSTLMSPSRYPPFWIATLVKKNAGGEERGATSAPPAGRRINSVARRLSMHMFHEPLFVPIHQFLRLGFLFRSKHLEQFRLDARLLHDQLSQSLGLL